jgi:hypothetical protein
MRASGEATRLDVGQTIDPILRLSAAVSNSDDDEARLGDVHDGMRKGMKWQVASASGDSNEKPGTSRERHLLDEIERSLQLVKEAIT